MSQPTVVSLLDRLPEREFDGIVEPIQPFLRGDSFEDWAQLELFKAGHPPLSADELEVLRKRWGR